MTRRALAALAVLALVLVVASASAEPRTVAGLVLDPPQGAEVTEESDFPEGVRVVAVTRGDEVLVLTTYMGKTAPKAKQALKVHVEAMEREIADQTRLTNKTVYRKLLGKNRAARQIRYQKGAGAKKQQWSATVVAARRSKVTVVAAWHLPESAFDTAFSPKLVRALTLE